MSVLPPSFPTGASKKERAVILAPIINEMCQRMLSGVDIGGVESFQYQILALIKKAELLKEEQYYDVEQVGCHPDNREGSGIVAADCQDLLLIMYRAGFNPFLLKLLACEILDGPLGVKWREFNEQVAKDSHGYFTCSESRPNVDRYSCRLAYNFSDSMRQVWCEVSTP